MADSNEAPYQPSALWRTLSSTVMFNVGGLCRAFLLLCSKTEVNGLEPFLELVDSRRDPTMRERGLVTGEFDAMLMCRVALCFETRMALLILWVGCL